MASFPDLRPVVRSAQAESRAVPSSRFASFRVAAAALAGFSLRAFLAVSELATLGGAKALVRTSALPTHVVGRPAPDIGSVNGASA
jgi:hypothetical protein